MRLKPERKKTGIHITISESFNETVKFKKNMYEVRLSYN